MPPKYASECSSMHQLRTASRRHRLSSNYVAHINERLETTGASYDSYR